MKIGKLGEASIFVSCYVPHDQIWISPKEEEMMMHIIDILDRLSELKEHQKLLAEPMIKLKAAMAEYVEPASD